jgi:S-DNA-T family DNA segregation ATPase FtsK/SpoIIIE
MSIALTVIRTDRIFVSTLPAEIRGKHWVHDVDSQGRQRRLASIEALDNVWVIRPAQGIRLIDTRGEYVGSVPLQDNRGLYRLKHRDGHTSSLLVENPSTGDKTFKKLGFLNDLDITIGRSTDCHFSLQGAFISSHHALLRLAQETFSIIDTNSSNGVFVNGRAIPKNSLVPLKTGDVVYILGLKIMIGKQFIAYNNPGDRLTVASRSSQVLYTPQEVLPGDEGDGAVGDDGTTEFATDRFYRSPRIKRDIETKTFAVEEPPAAATDEETPATLRIGPSLGMALASAMMGLYMVTNMMGGTTSWLRALPMLGMVVTMILGAVLWPNLSSRYNKKKKAEKEVKRRTTYSSYLDKARTELLAENALQAKILTENRISVSECFERVFNRDHRLFERTGTQSDFLELRVGIGDVPLDAKITWPQDKLSLDDDALRARVLEFSRIPQVVQGVPLALSLVQDFASGIVGPRADAFAFLRGLIAQVVSLHAPDEVKIVLLCDEEEREEWEFVCSLPHVFDDTFTSRHIASNASEVSEISLRFERELQQRREKQKAELIADYGTYYLVIVAERNLASRADFIKTITSLRSNLGFSVVTLASEIRDLPKECTRIIEIGPLRDEQGNTLAQLFNPNDATGSRTVFLPDGFVQAREANTFAVALAAIEIDTKQSTTQLPKSIGFLELFEAAKVEHLNVVSRWQDNNPCISLAAPVGYDAAGEPFMLNIHEDYHGPHGLIAGMTGSGKSEFIITYILSLALNYRPDEVSFVLIDYKGGGLAGAFDTEKVRLPHLAGTITNLDGAAINRSLISIQSELRRRQDVFNRARDRAGLGTMDIYKYQELYRLGVVDAPVPHLLIISDEFAELKAQQPEFMEQLISAARIGRSLGVHLILATQKPSGVVNDQIWSNARFKVCLKVAEAADSREMLKRPDAAELLDAGRFYLQVGYNEYFAMGQSAYAGTKYHPQERFIKKRDNSVVLISNTGRSLLGVAPEARTNFATPSQPEQVVILEHIAQVAADEGLEAPRLWLDELPVVITVDSLLKRYAKVAGEEEQSSGLLEPIIGELDDPWNQRQLPLTLPLSREGNAIIYGSTGSGKATLVASMLYSLLRTHSSRTLNAYVLDLGSESLGVFREAPQVGGVLFADDSERVERLFRMLHNELERRRKLLAAHGGGYAAYVRADTAASAEPLPNILVIINSFEVFSELYEKHLDMVAMLTRDGLRCGISFVLTCTRANGVPYRLVPNFKQKIALKLNSDDDYLNVIGSLWDVTIPTAYARGLIRLDKVYEFQGAQISDEGRENDAIRVFCYYMARQEEEKGAEGYRAPAVPALPGALTISSFKNEKITSRHLPVGIARDSLSVETFDFRRSPVMMVLGEDETLETRFLAGLIDVLGHVDDTPLVILDPDAQFDLEMLPSSASCFSSREDIVQYLERLFTDDTLAQGGFLVGVSLRSLLETLSPDLKSRFEQFVLDGGYKELDGLIFSGEPSRFSSFSYEPWYRELVSYGDGIWLGDGVGNQSVLKVGRILPVFREQLEKDFAFLVFKGTATLIKHVIVAD